MQHSHEALDRPGGFSRINLLAPLRHRDFRILWAGMTVSLLGDGIFLVAMAKFVVSPPDCAAFAAQEQPRNRKK